MAVAFIGALALAVAVLEIGTGMQRGWSKQVGRLSRGVVGEEEKEYRLSTWQALLIAVLPGRFDPNQQSSGQEDIASLIKRSGYLYDTPGDYYLDCIRTFTVYLIAGAVTAGAVYMLGLGVAAPFIAAFFIYLGLTRPRARLKAAIDARAEAMKKNMLPGLVLLECLLASSKTLENALKEVGKLGGPFCNLMLYFTVRLSRRVSAPQALEETRAHVPDPGDPEMQLFLKYISDFYEQSNPLLPAITSLRKAVYRNMVEDTQKRIALVMQRTSLFGIFAVVGLILSIILPFMNM